MSCRIMPINIEIRLSDSQIIAPSEKWYILYMSQAGEEKSPSRRIFPGFLNINPIDSAVMPITGRSSIKKATGVGSVPNTVKLST